MIPLSRIGQGTWNLPESGSRRGLAQEALRRGIELGMTHIDTAEMYGGGRVEEIVAEALEGIPRDRVFVTTKVLPDNAASDRLIAACERSLRRLRMDYVDLYLLHWPSSYPLAETMQALEALVVAGKARHIGVSNFDLDELAQARSYLRAVPLGCNQVLYHLQERAVELRLIPYCREHDIAVVGYTPFGRGSFPRRAIEPGGVIARVAAKYAKTPRQVILNFLTRDPGVFAIPKASTPEHVEENAGAAGWDLAPEDISEIDAAFPVHDGPLATL